MYYYLVWVRSSRYHGREALTYSCNTKLSTGSIVMVEMQREKVLGVVGGVTSKPRFATKPVARVYDLPPLPTRLIKTAQWLMDYYPAPLGIVSQQLLPASFSEKLLAEDQTIEFKPPDLRELPNLTTDQAAALMSIDQPNTYLLHGITGSGKTRLYIELAAQAINGGRSALILTPEISLTTQLADNLRAVFGQRVLVIHSGQTGSERQRAWLSCLKSKEPLVIVGPRSALFAPVKDIGLIVVDEAHEAAYKQEQAPQYQTSRVAGYIASISSARLVLGSATPAIADYYLASEKQKPIIELNKLATTKGSIAPSTVLLVDMKDRTHFTRSSVISRDLIEAIETSLSLKQQSLLYLNRRGTARLVMCDNCGWQASCPHCDLPLTYHGDSHSLRCHSCNYRGPSPSSCPVCNHPSVLFRSAGTKAIVDEVSRLFPEARLARYDSDNLKVDRFDQQYQKIKDGAVDILIGTQLIAKGLDLPKLSTLGILLADTSLYLPDFSATERTFQLITQVLGRVGRGHIKGQAIIQSYHPGHPIITAAVKADYASFYATELEARRQFFFPPFCFLLKLSCRRKSIKSAEGAALKLKQIIEASGKRVVVEGPAPSFYERLEDKYQWQLIVKAKERQLLVDIIRELPANWSYDIDPADLL